MRGFVCILFVLGSAHEVAAQPLPPDPDAPEGTPVTEPVPAESPPAAPPPPAAPIAVQTEPPPPALSDEAREALANYEPSTVRVGGLLQAQLRTREDSPVQSDQDGFRLARARLAATANTRAGNLDVSANLEAELSPSFAMLDAYARVSRYWKDSTSQLAVQAGQMRVPISRQQLLHESMLAFVDKAEIASLVPERDLGLQVSGSLAGFVRLTGGVFNGEGPNHVENMNQRYLWAGRFELTPFGGGVLAESGFQRFVTLGLSIGRNRLTNGVRRDEIGYLGVDVAGAYRGVSVAFEYLRAKTRARTVDASPPPADFQANGFTLQANYLFAQRLPPYRQSRFEVGVRLQEIDRNDTTPIAQAGDPTQSVRAVSAVATLYLRSHALKAQLEYTKFTELEDRTALAQDAAYANDQLVLQLTYRLD